MAVAEGDLLPMLLASLNRSKSTMETPKAFDVSCFFAAMLVPLWLKCKFTHIDRYIYIYLIILLCYIYIVSF